MGEDTGHKCSVQVGTEDGVLPIYCGEGNAHPMIEAGHALCPYHVRTAYVRKRNGTTTYHGRPKDKP